MPDASRSFPTIRRTILKPEAGRVADHLRSPGPTSTEMLVHRSGASVEIRYERLAGMRYRWTATSATDGSSRGAGRYLAKPAFQVVRSKCTPMSDQIGYGVRRVSRRRLVLHGDDDAAAYELRRGPGCRSRLLRLEPAGLIAYFPLRHGVISVSPALNGGWTDHEDFDAFLAVVATGAYRLVQRFGQLDSALLDVGNPFSF